MCLNLFFNVSKTVSAVLKIVIDKQNGGPILELNTKVFIILIYAPTIFMQLKLFFKDIFCHGLKNFCIKRASKISCLGTDDKHFHDSQIKKFTLLVLKMLELHLS